MGESQARQAGAALAQMHLAGADFPDRRPGRYEPDEIARRFAVIESRSSGDPELTAAAAELGPELARLATARRPRLPEGLIHGDLFIDNVLYRDGSLAALLDFEQASWGRLAYDLAVSVLAFGFGADDFRPDVTRAFIAGYATGRAPTAEEQQALPDELRFAACRFAVTRITDVHLRRAQGAPPGKDYRRYLQRLRALKRHLGTGSGLFGCWRRRSGLAHHGDVLAEHLLALTVEVHVADAHVHGRLAIHPHHLALDRQRGVQVGKVDHQVDRCPDIFDSRGLDTDAAQRDVLDAVVEHHLAAGVIDISVDFKTGIFARLLRGFRHRMWLASSQDIPGQSRKRSRQKRV